MVDRSLANNIIPIVGTLLPRTANTGIYRQAIWDYNSWIINYCNGRDGVYYVDFYNAGKTNIPPTPIEEPSYPGNFNPLYDGDSVFDQYGNLVRRGGGVHPSDLGYKIMAEATPLGIFKSLSADVKLYLDEACTTLENSNTTADLLTSYTLNIKNLNRGRIKDTIRYLKNTGSYGIIYTLYSTSEDGLELKLSNDGKTFGDSINGMLAPGGISKIDMKITVPQFGDVPKLGLNLAVRVFKTTL